MRRPAQRTLAVLVTASLALAALGSRTAAAESSASLLAAWKVPATPAAPGVAPQGRALPNGALAEPGWWAGADPDLYLSASPDLNAGSSDAEPMLDVRAGQTVYLTPSVAHRGAVQCPVAASGACAETWQVNSPDAHVRAAPSATGAIAGGTDYANSLAAGAFVASRAGVYTVRLVAGARASEPLVLVVGLDALAEPAWGRPLWETPEPVALLAADPVVQTGASKASESPGLTISVGTPVGSWLPVYGTLGTASTDAYVDVQLTPPDLTWGWDYEVPVGSGGRFSELLPMPYSGRVWVSASPAVVNPKTLVVKSAWGPKTLNVLVRGVGPAFSQALEETLPTQMLDYNDPAMGGIEAAAAAVWSNSPSPIDGAEALSNLVAEDIVYDYKGLSDGITPTVPASYGVVAAEGECQQYAEALTALYRWLGLRSVAVGGWAFAPGTPARRQKANANAHIWVKVLVPGMGWISTDPTFDSWGYAPLPWVTNAFGLATTVFDGWHLADPPVFSELNILGYGNP